jgi:hypothetical protein
MEESSDLAAAALQVVSRANDDNPSRQPYQVAITSAFLALSIPAVVLRIWVRRWLINALGSDDYMMMLALVSRLWEILFLFGSLMVLRYVISYTMPR